MLRFICCTVLLATPLLAKDCLQCICEVESGCRNPGCVPDAGSDSCGIYQIKLPYYIDCGTPEKRAGESNETAWRRCAQNDACARTCVEKYFNRYKKGCANLKKSDCEVMARNHNGGPRGCNKSATDGYWNKIKSKGCS